MGVTQHSGHHFSVKTTGNQKKGFIHSLKQLYPSNMKFESI